MTPRLITLRLGDTTDERHCGDCPHIATSSDDTMWCAVPQFRTNPAGMPLLALAGEPVPRLPDCLAAEAEAKRAAKVEAAARALLAATDAGRGALDLDAVDAAWAWLDAAMGAT
jgi:hypothetical protein